MGKLVKNSKPLKKISRRRKEATTVPPQILKNLSEFTRGGYILITGDSDGEARVFSQFDDSLSAMALVRFGRTYFEGADESISEMIFNGVPSPSE
jgi:predicted ATP-grasp superfamily ATP-dependent carboligase